MDMTLFDPTRLNLISPRQQKTQNVLEPLRKYLDAPSKAFVDEDAWTLMFLYGYFASDGWPPDDARMVLAEVLCGEPVSRIIGTQTSLLMWPFPPRSGTNMASEGNSEIDLMVGDFEPTPDKIAGVRFSRNSESTWICMTEVKWLEDISIRTDHDHERNQLVRVIENALTFQNQRCSPAYPDRVYVSLLTPAVFRRSRSRLYAYKFCEYQVYENLRRDLDMARVPKREDTAEWKYPDLSTRFEHFRLHWASHEDLFQKMPDSTYKDTLRSFIRAAGGGLLEI